MAAGTGVLIRAVIAAAGVFWFSFLKARRKCLLYAHD